MILWVLRRADWHVNSRKPAELLLNSEIIYNKISPQPSFGTLQFTKTTHEYYDVLCLGKSTKKNRQSGYRLSSRDWEVLISESHFWQQSHSSKPHWTKDSLWPWCLRIHCIFAHLWTRCWLHFTTNILSTSGELSHTDSHTMWATCWVLASLAGCRA